MSSLHITPPHLSQCHIMRIHFFPLGSIKIPIKSNVSGRIIQERAFRVTPTCKRRIPADVLPGGHSAPQPMSVCLRPPVSSILSWLAGPALSPAAHPPRAELATLDCNTWRQHKFYICSITTEEQSSTLPLLFYMLFFLLYPRCTQLVSICMKRTARANASQTHWPSLIISNHLIHRHLFHPVLTPVHSGGPSLSLGTRSKCHKRHWDLNLINDQCESDQPTFSIKSWHTQPSVCMCVCSEYKPACMHVLQAEAT